MGTNDNSLFGGFTFHWFFELIEADLVDEDDDEDTDEEDDDEEEASKASFCLVPSNVCPTIKSKKKPIPNKINQNLIL